MPFPLQSGSQISGWPSPSQSDRLSQSSGMPLSLQSVLSSLAMSQPSGTPLLLQSWHQFSSGSQCRMSHASGILFPSQSMQLGLPSQFAITQVSGVPSASQSGSHTSGYPLSSQSWHHN